MKKYIKFERNRVFIMLTLILMIFIFIIIRECDFPIIYNNRILDYLFVSTNTDKLFYNISISYVSAYIFYIIEIYIPLSLKNKKAINIMKENVIKEIRLLKYFLYIFDKSTYKEGNKYVIKQNIDYPFYILIEEDNGITYLKRFTYNLSLSSFCESLKEVNSVICNSSSVHDADAYVTEILTNIPIEKIISLLKYICDNKDKIERCSINSKTIENTIKQIELLEQIDSFYYTYICKECINSSLKERYDCEQAKNNIDEYMFTIDIA